MARKDSLVVALAWNKEVRLVVADTYYLIRQAQRIHHNNNEDFSKFLICSLLYTQSFKEEEELLVKLTSPEIEMSALANKHGQIKADVEILSNQAISQGILQVVRTIGRESFTSSIEIGSANVDDIFTQYYLFSEQVASCTQVQIGKRKKGFLLQLLPGASKETKRQVHDVLGQKIDYQSVATILKSLGGEDYQIVSSIEAHYHCNCSKRKYEQKITSLQVEELERLLAEDRGINVVCPFCHRSYDWNTDQLTKIIQKKRPLR
ncbi:MAG: Hsp33 family molecular chaperone HslO [Acholeplasmatales bacterium]|jgi:redox-regulated HSP33 family molecular chaperone|nr:Hsp33 family molecular chaperone HslO [Acholeplasmatales bacterium]